MPKNSHTIHRMEDYFDTQLSKLSSSSKAQIEESRRQVDFIKSFVKFKNGKSILDLPCGTGRHSRLLGESGYHVKGVDISKDSIKIAKATNPHPNVEYSNQSIADLPGFKIQFDAVVSLFSCIGYFQTDKENLNALTLLVSSLKPGGKFIISTANRHYVENSSQNGFFFEQDGFSIARVDQFYPDSQYLNTRLLMINQETQKGKSYFQRRRLYSKEELIGLLTSLGITSIKAHADYNHSRFYKYDSPHLILVGKKK